MDYSWWDQGDTYWSAPDSVEEPEPTSIYYVECECCGGDHFSFQCPNPYDPSPHAQGTYHQPPPNVQEDVPTRGKTIAEFAQEHWDKYGSFDLSTFPPQRPSDVIRMYYSRGHCEEHDSHNPSVSTFVQPTPPEAPHSVDTIEEEKLELRAEIDAFKRCWDSRVENVPKRDPLREMLQEDVGLVEDQMGLVDILEAIDPFDSDSDEELVEYLAMTSSSQDEKLPYEERLEENVQIPNKEEGEVSLNIEIDDLKPSLNFDEMKEEEHELRCLELQEYIVEFEKALVIELPCYILKFEESPMLKFPPYSKFMQRGVGEIGMKIDYDRLRRGIPPMHAKLWELNTFPWDPGGCREV